MKVNETYEIMFHLKSGNHHSTFSMNGNDPQTGSMEYVSFPMSVTGPKGRFTELETVSVATDPTWNMDISFCQFTFT